MAAAGGCIHSKMYITISTQAVVVAANKAKSEMKNVKAKPITADMECPTKTAKVWLMGYLAEQIK